MNAECQFRFHLNGVATMVAAAPDRRLIDVLRDDLNIVAAKKACGIGRCGACLVLMEDVPVNSCLLMMWQVEGARITTPEGLDALPEARHVRAALIEENAFQCGYCAPGFTVALTALLRKTRSPDEAAIRNALGGNLCRCTGYHSIVRGALRSAEMAAETDLPRPSADN